MNTIQPSHAETLEIKKSRGGQKKTSLAVARAKLWCIEVKSRTNLSYKALDEIFLSKNSEEEFLEPPKVFEKIERNGISPKGNDYRKSFNELIEAVDRHPDFLGTAIVFNSKIWELFEVKSISKKEILMRIDDVFREHGLERYPVPEMESWRYSRNPELDVVHPVNPMEMLKLQAASLPKITWEYMTLLFYLFSKTTVAANSERLVRAHTASLKDYFESRLGNFGRECFLDAINRINAVQVSHVF